MLLIISFLLYMPVLKRYFELTQEMKGASKAQIQSPSVGNVLPAFCLKVQKISIALSVQTTKFRFQGCLIPLEWLKASISHKTAFKTDWKTILCLSGPFATKRNQLRSPNPQQEFRKREFQREFYT